MRMIIFALLLAISYAQTDSDTAQLAMERKDSGLINEAEVAVAGRDGNVCCQCCDGTYGMSGSRTCSICKGQTDVMFQHPDPENCRIVDPKDKKTIKACADKCKYEPVRDSIVIPDSGELDTCENVCCKCCDGRFAFSTSGRCSPCGGDDKISQVFVHSDTSCRNPAPAGKGKVKACAGTCKDVQNPYLISPDPGACPRFESKVASAVDSIDAHVDTYTTIWIGCIALCIVILFTLHRRRKNGSELSISFLPANELSDLTTTL